MYLIYDESLEGKTDEEKLVYALKLIIQNHTITGNQINLMVSDNSLSLIENASRYNLCRWSHNNVFIKGETSIKLTLEEKFLEAIKKPE